MDLSTGERWRRLNDHPSAKPEDIQIFLPIVEGRPFIQPHPDASFKQAAAMGADGIAISEDGKNLYYCLLGSSKLYSVDTDSLINKEIKDAQAGGTVIFGDKGGAQMDLNLMQMAIFT